MKVWQIRIKAKSPKSKTLREVVDKDKAYYAEFQYSKGPRGNWKMTHDYSVEKIYAGTAVNIGKAIIAALKCAKKDGVENPEVIAVIRLGDCDFRK